VLTYRVGAGRSGGGRRVADTDDTVTATGVLARQAGTVVSSDGTGSEHWLGTTDTGGCYDRTLTAAHGWLTADVTRPCRLPLDPDSGSLTR
jgi:hypothetical protein